MFQIDNQGFFRPIGCDDQPPFFIEDSPAIGGALDPSYILIHYTAGLTYESAVHTFCQEDAKVSAHLIIGREGEVIQCVPFQRQAWHAGRSRWGSVTSLNRHSIGIELVNAGRLERRGGNFEMWTGRPIPSSQVHIDSNGVGWHGYTEKQLQSLMYVCSDILRVYDIKDILGHEDVAPKRKIDPGPAFPMASIKANLLGRGEEDEEDYITTRTTPVFSLPDSTSEQVDDPLSVGTIVIVEEEVPGWCFITIESFEGELLDPLAGWVRRQNLDVYHYVELDMPPHLGLSPHE